MGFQGLVAVVPFHPSQNHGERIAKLVSEKNMSIINGFVFLSVGMEIVYSNKYLNIM